MTSTLSLTNDPSSIGTITITGAIFSSSSVLSMNASVIFPFDILVGETVDVGVDFDETLNTGGYVENIVIETQDGVPNMVQPVRVVDASVSDKYENEYSYNGITIFADPDAVGTGDGLTPENAVTTIGEANNKLYRAGDGLLLKAGAEFTDTLYTNQYGEENNYCQIGAYGAKTESMPLINKIEVWSGLVWTDRTGDLGANIWTTPQARKIGRLWENDIELSRAYDEDYTQDFGATYRFHTNTTTDELYLYSTTDPTPNTYHVGESGSALDLTLMSHTNIQNIRSEYANTKLKNCSYLNLLDCDLSKNATMGISFEGDTYDIRPHHILIDGVNCAANWKGGDLSTAYQGHESDTRGCEDGLHVTNYISDIEIRNSVINGWGHSIVNMLADYPQLIENFYLHHCTISGEPDVSYGKGIDIIGPCENIRIHYNHILNVPVSNALGTQNISWEFNIIEHQRSCSIRYDDGNENNGNGFHISAKDVPYEARDYMLANNIFIGCEGSAISMYAQSGNAGDDIRNLVFKNNIFSNCGTAPDWNGLPVPSKPTIYQETAQGASIIENIQYLNNLIDVGGNGYVAYYGGNQLTVADFEAAVLARGTDVATGNVEGTPTFLIDTFILQAGSDGIGIALEPENFGTVVDYAGELITQGVVGSGFDVGVYNQGTT